MAAMTALQSSMAGLSLFFFFFVFGAALYPISRLSIAETLGEDRNPTVSMYCTRCMLSSETLKVISGRDKGKIGEITRIFRHNSTAIVKDINLKTKHMKSREEGEPGQIVVKLNYGRDNHYAQYL